MAQSRVQYPQSEDGSQQPLSRYRLSESFFSFVLQLVIDAVYELGCSTIRMTSWFLIFTTAWTQPLNITEPGVPTSDPVVETLFRPALLFRVAGDGEVVDAVRGVKGRVELFVAILIAVAAVDPFEGHGKVAASVAHLVEEVGWWAHGGRGLESSLVPMLAGL